MNIEIFQLQEGVSNALLTAYIQNPSIDHKYPIIRPAIIIFPGGAYMGITEKEAEPVGMKFLAAGYHVFILKYSIGVGVGRFPAPFIDAAKAIMLVRENAERWCVDPEKIVLCGFSSGGHVASVVATSWQEEYLEKAIQADSLLFKPNGLILCYPLLDLYQFKIKNIKRSKEFQATIEIMFAAIYGKLDPSKEIMDQWNCKNKITKHMPPTFMWTTSEDTLVDVEESLDFIKAMNLQRIPYEFHIFQKGKHGLSVGDQTVGYTDKEMKNHINAHKWMDLALDWLNRRL